MKTYDGQKSMHPFSQAKIIRFVPYFVLHRDRTSGTLADRDRDRLSTMDAASTSTSTDRSLHHAHANTILCFERAPQIVSRTIAMVRPYDVSDWLHLYTCTWLSLSSASSSSSAAASSSSSCYYTRTIIRTAATTTEGRGLHRRHCLPVT